MFLPPFNGCLSQPPAPSFLTANFCRLEPGAIISVSQPIYCGAQLPFRLRGRMWTHRLLSSLKLSCPSWSAVVKRPFCFSQSSFWLCSLLQIWLIRCGFSNRKTFRFIMEMDMHTNFAWFTISRKGPGLRPSLTRCTNAGARSTVSNRIAAIRMPNAP